MRVFSCERCHQPVGFEAQHCPGCNAALGYESSSRSPRELLPTAVNAAYTLHDSGRLHWRCLNAAFGCNGILLANASAIWCRACALTRGRPDEGRSDALHAWAEAEAAKRRVLHQLDEMGLVIVPRSFRDPHGLAFDFVALPGVGSITGYRDGVVTLDLAEVDDVHRDAMRRRFGERYRSVLGHLRHELGHYFREQLVVGRDAEEAAREVFGDERADYAAALVAHYGATPGTWDGQRFVSAYASAHPLEDWAETFASYLQLLDLVDTSVARGLVDDEDGVLTGSPTGVDLGAVRRAWRDLSPALTDLGAALGGHSGFPPDLTDGVMSKLTFVHAIVAQHVADRTRPTR